MLNATAATAVQRNNAAESDCHKSGGAPGPSGVNVWHFANRKRKKKKIKYKFLSSTAPTHQHIHAHTYMSLLNSSFL